MRRSTGRWTPGSGPAGPPGRGVRRRSRAAQRPVSKGSGIRPGGGQIPPVHHRNRGRAIDLAVRLPTSCWQRLSARTGAKGERWYDWALVEVTDPAVADSSGPNCCSSGAGSATGNTRSSGPTRHASSRSPSWSGSPGSAGSRSRSPAGRNSPLWTSTRFAAGPPGAIGPSWPCSPTPSGPC